MVTATRVFACGEDSIAWPLTSELDALCGENVNRIPCAMRCGSPIQTKSERLQKKEKRYPEWDTAPPRVFAYGEDSIAWPLTSELDALCGENVNRIPCVMRCGSPIQTKS